MKTNVISINDRVSLIKKSKIQNTQNFKYKNARNNAFSFKSSNASLFDQFNKTKTAQELLNSIKNQNNTIIHSQNIIEPSIPNTKMNTNKQISTKKILAITLSALSVIAGGIILAIKAKKKPQIVNEILKSTETETIIDKSIEFLKNEYSKLVEKFPEDKQYYEKLATEIGLNQGEEYKLSSLVGKSQLTALLNKFTFQDFQVGDNFEGVKNLTYRVNLHNHTQASDGSLSVYDFLEQAKKWADKVAEKVKDGKPPFTIAITDHDTLEGAQEAVKIIVSNPEKYKNLRVVLGSEISISHINPKDVKAPLNFELIGYSLNPFNKTMCNLLKDLRNSRIETSKNIINEINSKISNIDLNWNEASKFHPNLGLATSNGSIYLLRQYAAFKYAAVEYSKAIGNKISVDELMNKYVKDYLNKVEIKEIAEGDVQTYFRNFKLPDNSTIKDFSINKDVLKMLTDIRNDYVLNSQKLIDNKVILTPEQFFTTYRNSEDSGMFGLAHPGFLNTSMFSKEVDNFCTMHPENDRGHHLAWRLYKYLNETGKDLFKCAEINYQSYDKNTDRAQWVKKMNDLAKGFNLLKAGGIDCHKPSIFLKHEILTQKQINELNLQEIVGII